MSDKMFCYGLLLWDIMGHIRNAIKMALEDLCD